MKKSILGLEGVAVLSKQQQKGVNGGGGSCCTRYFIRSGVNGSSLTPVVNCDISKADAVSLASGPNGGNWCCASCSSASWTTIG